MSLTATAVVAEHGAVYKDAGQGVKDLISFLKQPAETEKYFPSSPTKDTVIHKTSVEFARTLQAYQKGFTPIGGMTFKPRKIPLYDLKIDDKITPRDLQNTYLGFLADKGIDPKEMPITKFYQTFLIQQAIEDYDLHEVYKGVLGTITPGTANAAGANVNGIRKQINLGITAGTVNEIALGAVPTDEVDCAMYMQDFVDTIEGLNPLLYKQLDHIFVDPAIAKRFRRGNKVLHNMYYAAKDSEELSQVDESKITVVGLQSMAGSGKIWTTPRINRARFTKNESQSKLFDVQALYREVNFLTDFQKGIGFWIDQWIFSNDQDKA